MRILTLFGQKKLNIVECVTKIKTYDYLMGAKLISIKNGILKVIKCVLL